VRALRYVASAFLLIAPAAAIAQQTAAVGKPTVAIMPVTVAALSVPADTRKALEDALANMLATEFGNKPAIQLIERQQVSDLLTRQQLMVSGRMSEADAVRAGKLLGAQYVVFGSVFIESKTARMDIRLVDTESGLNPKAPFKKSGSQDKLLDIVQELADDFTRDLKLVNRAVVAATEQPLPVAVIMAYSRGLDYEKRGKKQMAAEQYRKALELSPSHAEAKAALDRVR